MGVAALGLGGLLLLSGCTASFCSPADQANMLYPYDQGVTVYCDKEDIPEAYADSAFQIFEGNDVLYGYIPKDDNGNFSAPGAAFLRDTVLAAAASNGQQIPSDTYFAFIDQKTVEVAVDAFIEAHSEDNPETEKNEEILIDGEPLSRLNITAEYVNAYNVDEEGNQTTIKPIDAAALREFGHLKYWGPEGNEALWAYFDAWTDEARLSTEPGLGYLNCPSADFENSYKTQALNKISAARSCIATQDGNYGHYGPDNEWDVAIEGKDWGYAWQKGFFEGLLVFPIAWLTDTIAYAIDPAMTGVPQIIALCLVTLIVRAFMVLVSFRSTISQQKMQALQPQLAKLQAKYPNSNTNQAQQQRLAQEQMALYKRNKIHPFSSMLVLVVQFPLFLCVWGAFQGSSVLSSGAVLNLRLSDTISTVFFNFTGEWYLNSTGWWTALVLFIFMAAAQIVSMLLPQWINKKRLRKVARLTKNPAQDKNTKTMKWVMYGMMVFTIIMGFFLPSAMAVYWFIGALISMVQTAITQAVIAKQDKKKKERRYR